MSADDDDPVWDRLAHLHAQDCEHGEAYIVANRGAVEALRDALTQVLSDGFADVEMLAADGEGYRLRVVVDDASFEDASRTWALPYAGAWATESREHVIWPWRRWADLRRDTA